VKEPLRSRERYAKREWRETKRKKEEGGEGLAVRERMKCRRL